MNKKRWFISLVCLMLVVSMVAPVPALATCSTYLSTYQTSVDDCVSYLNYNYFCSSLHHSYVLYNVDGYPTRDYQSSRTITYEFDKGKAGKAVTALWVFAIALKLVQVRMVL